MILQERCGWDGGLIVACASWDIMPAVQRHQATPAHKAARRRVALVEANRAYRARIRAAVAEKRLLLALEREAA